MINEQTNKDMTKFETSEVYKMGWVTDAEMFNHFIVIRRTDKTVWIQEFSRPDSEIITLRIYVWANVEQVKPFGSYSMAPILSADKVSNIVDSMTVLVS